jgi:hypothetical protein
MRLLPVLAAGSLLALAGCQTADVESKISAVQSGTRIACKFVPTVATVAKILAAGNPLVDSAKGVADAICNAVTTAPLADGPGDRTPRVNGVVVKGQFVR